jgi:MinD-like ATPase involved in chromosome partitioning or flagellar assembly
MAKIITVNAFHQGAGVSTIAANLAVVIAQRGLRVALIDACISSPTQYLLFNLGAAELPPTFNDFLLARCDLLPAARAVSSEALALGTGKLFLVPADPDWREVGRAQQAPAGVDTLGPAVRRLVALMRLDAVVVDSDAELVASALAAIALSDVLLTVVQLDHQRYQEQGVALGVAGEVGVPRTSLVVNLASPSFDPEVVRQAVEHGYGAPVAGVVPYCEELAALCSLGVFVVRYPEHPVSGIFRKIGEGL